MLSTTISRYPVAFNIKYAAAISISAMKSPQKYERACERLHKLDGSQAFISKMINPMMGME